MLIIQFWGAPPEYFDALNAAIDAARLAGLLHQDENAHFNIELYLFENVRLLYLAHGRVIFYGGIDAYGVLGDMYTWVGHTRDLEQAGLIPPRGKAGGMMDDRKDDKGGPGKRDGKDGRSDGKGSRPHGGGHQPRLL